MISVTAAPHHLIQPSCPSRSPGPTTIINEPLRPHPRPPPPSSSIVSADPDRSLAGAATLLHEQPPPRPPPQPSSFSSSQVDPHHYRFTLDLRRLPFFFQIGGRHHYHHLHLHLTSSPLLLHPEPLPPSANHFAPIRVHHHLLPPSFQTRSTAISSADPGHPPPRAAAIHLLLPCAQHHLTPSSSPPSDPIHHVATVPPHHRSPSIHQHPIAIISLSLLLYFRPAWRRRHAAMELIGDAMIIFLLAPVSREAAAESSSELGGASSSILMASKAGI